MRNMDRLPPRRPEPVYYLSDAQKQACEVLWRRVHEQNDRPLGLDRDMLSRPEPQARYMVAQTVWLIPSTLLADYVAREIETHGPLPYGYQLNWTSRTMQRRPPPLSVYYGF